MARSLKRFARTPPHGLRCELLAGLMKEKLRVSASLYVADGKGTLADLGDQFNMMDC